MNNRMFALAILLLLSTLVALPQATQPTSQGQTTTVAVLQTDLGNIVISFFPNKAPNHVHNFENLVQSGFYNGTKFHRAVPQFMVQGGDPNTKYPNKSTWGQGGNVGKNGREVNVNAEFNDVHHRRGIVSMARAQNPNSASSQFFICLVDAPYLDRQYTVFGEVVEGMNVVDSIVNAPKDPIGPDNPEGSRPSHPVSIKKAWLEQRPTGFPANSGTTASASPVPSTPNRPTWNTGKASGC